jgi:hypothetical protein
VRRLCDRLLNLIRCAPAEPFQRLMR